MKRLGWVLWSALDWQAFIRGIREFRLDVTTHYDHPRIEVYDTGRELAHRLTLRRYES